jgi:DNA-binding HxlR family transcriptional regulator
MPEASPDAGDSVRKLRELVSQPHVIEVLDALSSGPMTMQQLRSAIPRARRGISRVLRDLVVCGLVNSGTAGSRDDLAAADLRYQHTEQGRLVVRMLASFSVWTMLYDGPGAVTNPGR